MTGTKRCDDCWEVEHRLNDYLRHPNGRERAVKIIERFSGGEMRHIREVRGILLRDGREWWADERHALVMYDIGVQEEDDNGGVLFEWDQIIQVFL